jgi:hypothetical protein
MGTSIFNQMMLLLHPNGKKMYTKGYMYGCISQNFTESDTELSQCGSHKKHNNLQSSWGTHEAWLQILQVAEMAVILHSIAEGGSVFLKIRIFQKTATQYMCALFANLFDSFDIVPVPQQLCGFVLVHYKDKKTITPTQLTEITSYLLDSVDSKMEIFHPPLWCQPTIENLKKVEIASTEMERYRDDSLHFMKCAVEELKIDTHKQNVFATASSRIPYVSDQISMTNKLRNAMFSSHHKAGNRSASHEIWESFMNDFG